MSWRIVSVSSIAKLDYKMDYLVVRSKDETKRVHLSEISALIIENTAISLTAYLLCELSKNKIDVIFCDEKRLPYGRLSSLHGSHDTSRKYRQQAEWKSEVKALVWAEIVKAKLAGQMSVLPEGKTRECELIASYIPQVKAGDVTNREGHAAKVYFNALFGMDFSRDAENNINAALNYGYSILLSVFAREAEVNGYCTQIGIFHDNMFNEFNLACDLMEPFRPFVDKMVAELDHSAFEHDEKVKLVKLLNDQITIGGNKQYMLNGIRIYVKSVFDAIENKDVSAIRFPAYEL